MTDAQSEWGESRRRTITWHDPGRTARAAAELTGLEFMAAIRRGELAPPPIVAVMGMELVSVTEGDVVFGCTPDESLYNPIGGVHGGLACTMLDSALACSVHTTLPAGVAYTSVELKVNYLRPISHGMSLRAHGWVVKPGRRIAFAEGDIRDEAGKILATASGTCLIMS